MMKIEGSGSKDPDPNTDLLVRGMDPRIRIRIHTKMSWIRYTVYNYFKPPIFYGLRS
jgi:hypothetical protein